MKVRIGFGLGTRGLRDDTSFIGIMQDLDRLGYDSIWLSERLTSPTADPVVGLAVAAGATRRLKLGTSVLVLPGRNLPVFAKELASLDRLSKGRLLLAFGLGASEAPEHQAFGVEPKSRGRMFDEALPLLRRMWTEDEIAHEGAFYRYESLSVRPKPIQNPLEVWMGGLGPLALKRTGRLSDGWLPSFCTPADAAAGRPVIEAAAAEAGREMDPEHFGAIVVYTQGKLPDYLVAQAANRRPGIDPTELFAEGYDGLRERIKRFVDVGTSKFIVRPAEEPADWSAELERLAEAALPLQT
ncbi:MAG: TIGR03619 family F420-dependent LLM class oxidoreductase [Chloroflexota bacterium]